MALIGNNGVEVVKEVRADGTYYICSDGIDFLYSESGSVNFLGNNGVEYTYNEDKSRLIANDGNDAIIKTVDGIITIRFLDGTEFVGAFDTSDNPDEPIEYGLMDETTLENFYLV